MYPVNRIGNLERRG